MNDKGVCTTAPATPSLSIISRTLGTVTVYYKYTSKHGKCKCFYTIRFVQSKALPPKSLNWETTKPATKKLNVLHEIKQIPLV